MSLCPALIALGRLQSRRGDPEAARHARRGVARARSRRGELQRLAPAAAARAENAWLDGELERVAQLARSAYALAADRGDVWARAELALWLRRAGATCPRAPDDPEPYARGDGRGLARRGGGLSAIGFPYELRRGARDADDEDARLEALARFDELGASRVAAHLRRRLRADGVRRIPRGPRAASRRRRPG